MLESVQTGLTHAGNVVQESPLRESPNGVRFAQFGETNLVLADLERLVQAVPNSIASVLIDRAFYFVPLALAERSGDLPKGVSEPSETLIAAAFSPEWSELAVCHRDVRLGSREGIFISTRLLGEPLRPRLRVLHQRRPRLRRYRRHSRALLRAGLGAGARRRPWRNQPRCLGQPHRRAPPPARPKARCRSTRRPSRSTSRPPSPTPSPSTSSRSPSTSTTPNYASAEYPLLAPQPLAERLRLVARLFPPNSGYEFAIRYRRATSYFFRDRLQRAARLHRCAGKTVPEDLRKPGPPPLPPRSPKV